jgi:hypothetical protein
VASQEGLMHVRAQRMVLQPGMRHLNRTGI